MLASLSSPQVCSLCVIYVACMCVRCQTLTRRSSLRAVGSGSKPSCSIAFALSACVLLILSITDCMMMPALCCSC